MEHPVPRSGELATRALLDGRDVDEIARLVHNLIGEIATLTARVEALEAKAAGDPVVPVDPIATGSAIVKRVVG